MDHLHAQQTRAAERYLLGELPAGEAEEFELHYFECRQCALAVEAGESFMANARACFREPENPKPQQAEAHAADRPRRSFLGAVAAFWRSPVFTVPVMAALASLAIYQGVVLNTAAPLPSLQLIGASRGDEPVLHIPPRRRFAQIEADIPPAEPFKQYLCVLTRDGREVTGIASPAPEEGQPITILFPVAKLKAGHQDLTLYGLGPDGARSDRISTYPFSVQFN